MPRPPAAAASSQASRPRPHLLRGSASWNHQGNQLLFATEFAIQQLLSFLTPAGRAEVIGSHWSEVGGGDTDLGTEIALYSMMALVNFSYCRLEVQELVRVCGGVPLLHQHLSSPIFQLRRTAAFCLGNLVRDHFENAQEVVTHGGVELLLRCVTDEEEDELSKTAYSTIAHLGATGL